MSGGMEAAGDLATGGLIGRAFEPRAGEAVTGAHGHGLCLNCGTALAGDFCHHCGQSAHVHSTLASIGHDLLHGVWHFEGKIWSTLPMLFTRPGQLTRRYIAGERARFVSPLALFLFSVFLMVATFSTIGGPIGGNDLAVNRNGAKLTPPEVVKEIEQQKANRIKLVAERDALRAKGADTDKIDARIESVDEDIDQLQAAHDLTTGKIIDIKKSEVKTGWGWLDYRLKHMLEEPKLYLYKMQSSAYKYSWALIPISLPFIWLLFAFRRDVGPYDHAIFAIYSLSAMTMGAVLLSFGKVIGLPGGMIATILTFGPPLHMYKQLRGAYGIGRFGALWRTVALLFFAMFAGIIFFFVILGLIA
ncbi:MAG: hypothetical protein B7Y45_00600 [Sphingomonas sp. 28-66-16]|nr:MAG: hypothetical protein B7Y45_00600 [Sphingomonas sp. 28-66-16]